MTADDPDGPVLRLAYWLERRGLTVRELARLVPCPVGTLYDYCRNGRTCSADRLWRLARALRCTPNDLYHPAYLAHVLAAHPRRPRGGPCDRRGEEPQDEKCP